MGIDNSLEVDEAIALVQILLLLHPYVVELNVDVQIGDVGTVVVVEEVLPARLLSLSSLLLVEM